MSPFVLSELPEVVMNPLVSRRVFHGSQMTIAEVALKQGAVVPEHHHTHEQTTMLRSGKLLFRMDGKDIIVPAGAMLHIPSGVPHEVTALEDSIAVDLFAPARDDWQRGDDAYLRANK